MGSVAIASNRVGMEITLGLNGQNVGANTSNIKRRCRFWRNSGTGIWGSGASWSSNGDGGNTGGSFNYDFRSTYEYVVLDQNFDKGHNADGTGSAYANMSGNMNNTSYPGGGSTDAGLGLPTIPRASTPSWSGNFEAGTAKTINMNRASSSFTHTVQYFFGSASGTIATGVTDNVSWTPPLSLLQQIPNAASGNGVIRVITDGIGTKDVGFTLVAPASAVPTINVPTITEGNSAVATVMGAGVYVQKLSNVKAVVSGSGYQSSTIAASEFTIGGVTAASGGTITPQTSGTVAVSSKVTDSRGRTATRSDNITVRAYSTPIINNLLVSRATSAGVVANEGTYLRVDLNAAVSSLVNGTEKNTLGIRVFTRLKGATTWTARNVINHSALTYNTNFLISGGAIAPVNQAFEIRVEIFDKFNTAAGQTLIATAAIYMNWATGGVGVGKYWEKGGLDVKGDIYSTSKLFVSGGGVNHGTTAQRDAFFGVPSNDVDRVLLANITPTWFNTDKGYWEQYLTISNKAGLAVRGLSINQSTGWYPLAGQGPVYFNYAAGNPGAAGTGWISLPLPAHNSVLTAEGFTNVDGYRLQPPVNGLWQVSFITQIAANNEGFTRGARVYPVNSSAANGNQQYEYYIRPSGWINSPTRLNYVGTILTNTTYPMLLADTYTDGNSVSAYVMGLTVRWIGPEWG